MKLHAVQRVKPRMFERLNPAILNPLQRNGIQVMQFAPPLPDGADEIGRLEHAEMLAHRLARHLEVFAELSQRLTVVLPQSVQQQAAARVGKRLEDPVHLVVGHPTIMQVFTCISSNVQVTPRDLARCDVGSLR